MCAPGNCPAYSIGERRFCVNDSAGEVACGETVRVSKAHVQDAQPQTLHFGQSYCSKEGARLSWMARGANGGRRGEFSERNH